MTMTAPVSAKDTTRIIHQLIDALPVSAMEAFLLLKELLDLSKGRGNKMKRAQQCIRLGAEALRHAEKSVSFSHALEFSLEARAHRRLRTLQEIRSVTRRMMRMCPEMKHRQVRSITAEDCRRWLDACFSSPRQWAKGRIILSGIFSFSVRQGWCRQNVTAQLSPPVIKEHRIRPLSLYETRQLLRSAREHFNGSCLPACALMLYAGLRPQETRRLTWDKINLKAGVLNITPNHSKTGGSRQVGIHPVLAELLEKHIPAHHRNRPVCPANWDKKWREVRRKSGILKKSGWVQDVLRHTFASYHLAYFRKPGLLEREMGHVDSRLLETRYLDMDRITPSTGERFWREVPKTSYTEQRRGISRTGLV